PIRSHTDIHDASEASRYPQLSAVHPDFRTRKITCWLYVPKYDEENQICSGSISYTEYCSLFDEFRTGAGPFGCWPAKTGYFLRRRIFTKHSLSGQRNRKPQAALHLHRKRQSGGQYLWYRDSLAIY